MKHFGAHHPDGRARPAAPSQGSVSLRGLARRPHGRALGLLCVLLAACGSGAIAYALLTAPTPPPQPTAAQAGTLPPARSGHRPASTAPPSMPASPPTRLRIPSLDLDAQIDTLGLNTDGTVQVPTIPDHAGWYDGSATPGQTGAAVLLGHVDFASTGPAVFYRLGEVKPGATILVARRDGSTATFTATAVREFPKSDFPTDEVYGATDGTAELRLITCGSWDPDQHAYVGNTVVFAGLARPAAAPHPSAKPSPGAAGISAHSGAGTFAAASGAASPQRTRVPPARATGDRDLR